MYRFYRINKQLHSLIRNYRGENLFIYLQYNDSNISAWSDANISQHKPNWGGGETETRIDIRPFKNKVGLFSSHFNVLCMSEQQRNGSIFKRESIQPENLLKDFVTVDPESFSTSFNPLFSIFEKKTSFFWLCLYLDQTLHVMNHNDEIAKTCLSPSVYSRWHKLFLRKQTDWSSNQQK